MAGTIKAGSKEHNKHLAGLKNEPKPEQESKSVPPPPAQKKSDK